MKGAFRVAPTVNTTLCKAIEPKKKGCRKIRTKEQEGKKPSSQLWQRQSARVVLVNPNPRERAAVRVLSLDLLRHCLQCRGICGRWRDRRKRRQEKRRGKVEILGTKLYKHQTNIKMKKKIYDLRGQCEIK